MKIKIIFVIAVFIMSCAISGCRKGNETAPRDKTVVTQEEAESLRYAAELNGCEVFDGVYVTEFFSYSGVFPEDGSDAEVADAAAVRLVNLSNVNYKYIEFNVDSDGKTYTFFVSTLLAGAKLTAVEKNAAVFETDVISSCSVTGIEAFDSIPSVHLDYFRISFGDGIIKLENKTGETKENVCVYYKNVDENGYFGGITYRVGLGGVPAGGTVSGAADKLNKNNSRIVFVTYDD